MKRILHLSAVLAVAMAFAVAASGQENKAVKKEPVKKAKAPNPAMAPIEDQAGLPRVLLIGDSISIGYTLPVRKLLEGKANVHRIPTNGGPTKNGTANIDKWLGTGKWDVIHFNFGLHDAKYMTETTRQVEPDEYERNLREIVKKLKATGARVIWANTTPVPKGDLNPPRKFEDIPVYNRVAAKVMKEEGVVINDLNAYITPTLETHQRPKDVHYTPEGYEQLAKQVAKTIETALRK